MNPTTEAHQAKPRLAIAIATAGGAGFLPKAPGTFGSLVGVILAAITWLTLVSAPQSAGPVSTAFALNVGVLAAAISLLGVWGAGRVAAYLRKDDPQIVVVDEVAGQLITYLGLAATPMLALDWKSILAGFLLFRLFDIWKPFPIRRAESLPGGLGIMADDWLAGVYAALLLALARHLGL